MLSPSDFNNAVPQFTNGDYASNPINPQYIAEPDAVDYNKGAEPLQTLPAQWWNWFINRFTNRFNKVNIYVKNIFNELTQLLSLVSETPSGTEGTPTVGQMKDMFETKYPDYLKTTPALSNTYVPQTTRVNGHELCENITITCVACASCNGSGTAFGTAATKNTGTAAGCIPIVGTALGTTNGQFIATDASGCLKPSGYSASSFRASSWTPTVVCCAKCNGSGVAFGSAATCDATAFRASTWTPSCVACAGRSYCVMDFCNNISALYIGYACAGLTCAQVTNLAAYSTNYISGKTVIKDVSKSTIQSWLGLGGAAYCAASDFRASTWTPSSVDCANYGKNGNSYSAFGSNAFNSNSYLLTDGCAADSAKLGGYTYSQVRSGLATQSTFSGTGIKMQITGNLFSVCVCCPMKCEMYKVLCCIAGGPSCSIPASGYMTYTGYIQCIQPNNGMMRIFGGNAASDFRSTDTARDILLTGSFFASR